MNMNFDNAPGRSLAEKAVNLALHEQLHDHRSQIDSGPNPAFGAGIGNYAGWAVTFGTLGLIFAGLATRSWIGAGIGALVALSIPTLITWMHRSSQRSEGFAAARPVRRLPGGVLAWTVVASLLGATAGYGMARALDVADETESIVRAVVMMAAFGAVVGLTLRLLIGWRRRSRAAP